MRAYIGEEGVHWTPGLGTRLFDSIVVHKPDDTRYAMMRSCYDDIVVADLYNTNFRRTVKGNYHVVWHEIGVYEVFPCEDSAIASTMLTYWKGIAT